MNTQSKEPRTIELYSVSKWFITPHSDQRLSVVENLNLLISEQEAAFVVLMGPSGCGKTTILHLIAGLLAPDEGEIRVCGEPVRAPNPNSVLVPQAYTCFPWLTALGNVEFGLAVRGYSRSERRHVAMEYLNRVGLGDRLDAYPKQLSGGMQQRVAIARTLALRPPVVLMDEPFGALDAQTRAEMQQLLLDLWKEEGNLIIFVTHDVTEALLLADRIIVFSSRPARIISEEWPGLKRPRDSHEPELAVLGERLLELLRSSGNSDRSGGARQLHVQAGSALRGKGD